MKMFTKRDSATAFLRKHGITKTDYALFIGKASDGKVGVRIDGDSNPIHFVVADKPKANGAAKPDQERQPTVASVCRELLLAGKTNAEVWAVVQPQFSLDDAKKTYPSWYRSELRRQGKLPA